MYYVHYKLPGLVVTTVGYAISSQQARRHLAFPGSPLPPTQSSLSPIGLGIFTPNPEGAPIYLYCLVGWLAFVLATKPTLIVQYGITETLVFSIIWFSEMTHFPTENVGDCAAIANPWNIIACYYHYHHTTKKTASSVRASVPRSVTFVLNHDLRQMVFFCDCYFGDLFHIRRDC